MLNTNFLKLTHKKFLLKLLLLLAHIFLLPYQNLYFFLLITLLFSLKIIHLIVLLMLRIQKYVELIKQKQKFFLTFLWSTYILLFLLWFKYFSSKSFSSFPNCFVNHFIILIFIENEYIFLSLYKNK
jgi:hypothetical protein